MNLWVGATHETPACGDIIYYTMWPHNNTWCKDHMTQSVGAPHCMLPPYEGQRHRRSGDVFNLRCDLARPSYLRAMWLYGKAPIKKSHHPNKFGGHQHYGYGDTLVLVCHVILQEHVIKALCYFMGSSP